MELHKPVSAHIYSLLDVFEDHLSGVLFTQKPPGGGLLCPERGEGEVSAHVWGAAKLVLRGREHLTVWKRPKEMWTSELNQM